MGIVKLLEKLATNAHHQVNLDLLMSSMPVQFKRAYSTNNSEELKSFLSGTEYLANESHVVKVNK